MGRAIVFHIGKKKIGVYMGDGHTGIIDSFHDIPFDVPNPPPIGDGQLLCLKPWSCTLDESDSDLIIRESIDAAESKVPYVSVLPGTLNQNLQPHPVLQAYRTLVDDPSRPWVFHIAETKKEPRIINQGPLDADAVLGWIGVPRVNYLADPPFEAGREDAFLDIDFENEKPEKCGSLRPNEFQKIMKLDREVNITSLQGFNPIPKGEWNQWTARFPIQRLAASIRHISDQVMGSCVGHACGNCVEGACYHMAGNLFFKILSFMSMYNRIGTRPNSGAYVGDASDEIQERGILPANGEKDINGVLYPHTHQVSGGFYDRLPIGWEQTAKLWKCQSYLVNSQEAAFRVQMDNRLRRQYGRSGHSISGFAVTLSNRWAYENSWGTNWGDHGKCIGYDSRFYSSYVYKPILRDEIEILVASEIHQLTNMLYKLGIQLPDLQISL